MRFRKLRIAWSVAWVAVALLLCMLWARSLKWYDRWELAAAHTPQFQIVSRLGQIRLAVFLDSQSDRFWTQRLSLPLEQEMQLPHLEVQPDFAACGVAIGRELSDGWFVSLVHSQAVLLAILLAALPWIRCRFSLRTLLIAATLVAVGLGLMVSATRG